MPGRGSSAFLYCGADRSCCCATKTCYCALRCQHIVGKSPMPSSRRHLPDERKVMHLMFYQLYELNHAAMAPYRAVADIMRLAYSNPLNPLSQTPWGRTMAAALEMFERTTRRYGKPSFDLPETVVGDKKVAVREEVVWARPFCNLLH